MQIHFLKEEMDKNIEFTKRIYEMKDLEGYNAFFDKFIKDKWARVHDNKMTIEKFLNTMEMSNFFVSKLFINEDTSMPLRYVINARIDSENDSFFNLSANFTNSNSSRIFELYYKTFHRGFK